MNNEIKEMLDKIQNVVEHKEASYNNLIETKAEDYKLLLDYITNLQQENDNLINLVKEFENKGYDIGQERADFLLEIKDLQQENETRQQDINNLTYQLAKMKEENERLKENNQNMQEEMARTWQKCDDYKSRCEKASEELKQAYTDIQNNDNANYIHIAFRNDLLNILQNGSDDNE